MKGLHGYLGTLFMEVRGFNAEILREGPSEFATAELVIRLALATLEHFGHGELPEYVAHPDDALN